MFATADQILSRKPTCKDVPCPELGEGVEVRIQRLDARSFIELMRQTKTETDNAFAYWIAASCINEDGSQMFTTERAKELGQVEFQLINRLASEAMKMNGVGVDTAEKK